MSGNDDDTKTCDMETTKDPERRKSKSGKRRSGFSRGRISLTQLSKEASGIDSDAPGAELYKQIPTDLPPSQRLSLLCRLVLRHTLEVLDKEFEDVPGFHNFRGEAIEAVGTTIDNMETDGSFEQACTAPSLVPNPANTQMDTDIVELELAIKRLQKEESDWEGLVHTLESRVQTAKGQLNALDMANSDVPEDVKTLAETFLPVPEDLPDLSAISMDVIKDVKNISLLMDDYCHSVHVLTTARRAAYRHMGSLANSLGQNNGSNSWDPKDTIQQLLAS